MVKSKESYGHGEFKNVLTESVQIPYLPVRGRKVPRFMGGSIRPKMEICRTSGLPILMVPRLHRRKGYMKRKLRAWRVQKCITLVGVDTVFTSAGPQSTPFHGCSIGPILEICGTSGLPILMVPRLHLSNGNIKKEATGMESSKKYEPSRCRYRTYLCGAAKYPVSWGVV